MGKLKFTLVNFWYWAALVFVAFLTENLLYLTSDPKTGFNMSTLIVLSLAAILCLFMFYFINHKQNKMKFDWVLLPAFFIVGATMLIGIWAAEDASFAFADGSGTAEVAFSLFEKIRASVILVIFLAFLYGILFASNINRPNSRRIVWFAYIGIFAVLLSVAYSLFTESGKYMIIFKGNVEDHVSIYSFYGNKNYYGGVLFVGILCCFIANYYRPRLHWYLLSVVLFVVLVSTVAVSPTLIMAVALPTYLLEEIIRFAVKRKWKYCIFALVSLLLLMALIILFYWGSTHQWDGFIGIDNYFSDTFNSKDFLTFTGRLSIWRNILPYCFDNPIHAMFGHGFLISEKYVLGITAAMNNSLASGVRTTHNGFIQILFDYGLVGVLCFIALFGYFIYACIRLMMEKRFHFVFVHFFTVLCACAFNCFESSSFFDSGVKEMFITITFLMPVIAEYKFLNHREKIEEIKNVEAEHKFMDPVRLGQSVALALMFIIVASGTSFIALKTYEITWLKYLMLNILIGASICLIFVPYLVTLFYKNKDRLHFTLHCVFNGLLIAASLVVLYLLFKYESSMRPLSKYIIPGLLFLILLLETIIYSLIMSGSFKEWAKVFFVGSFVIPRYAIVGGALLPVICTLVLQTLGMMNFYIYLVNFALSFIGYFMIFHFLPTNGGREIVDYFSELDLYNAKRIAIKDETYYG